MILDRIKMIVRWLIGQGLANSQEGIGLLLGYSNKSSFSQILNGKKPLPADFTERLSALDNKVNKIWIDTGRGEMLRVNAADSNAQKISISDLVPLVSIRARSGYLAGYGDPEYINELPTVPVITDRTFHGKYMCFEVEGDSMDNDSRNALCDGDIILGMEVKKDLWKSNISVKNRYFVIVHKEGIMIKQIVDYDVENGIITCHSLNPLYGDDFKLNLDDVFELFHVIRIVDRSIRK